MKKRVVIFLILLNCFSLFACEKLIPFQVNNKIGFLNEKMKVVFLPEFDDFIYCYEGWVIAINKNESSMHEYILNRNGKRISVPSGQSGFVIGKKHYGFTDFCNSTVYSLETDEKIDFPNFRFYSSTSEENIMIDSISVRPRCNYINLQGELLLAPNNGLKIEWFDKNINLGVRRQNGWAFLIDSNINPINEKKYGFINEFSCGLALTDKGFIDYKGNLIIPISRIPEMNINFQCDVIPIVITQQNTYELYSHEECMNANWAIINSEGKIIKSNIDADSISNFSKDGVAILYKFIKDKPFFYLINTQGEFVNGETFDKIYPSENGFSRARKNNEDYLINVKTGKIINCKDFFN